MPIDASMPIKYDTADSCFREAGLTLAVALRARAFLSTRLDLSA
jgi:hypothetical protein